MDVPLRPGTVPPCRLRRRDWIGIVFGALLLLSLLLTCVILIHVQERQSRDALRDRFGTRSALAASFVTDYVNDLAKREAAHAVRELAATDNQQLGFEKFVGTFDFDAAVMLDAEGRLLQVWPRRPDIIGRRLTDTYTHLEEAVEGKTGVSNVVPSAAQSQPVTAIAVPITTAQGTFVMSGAFVAQKTPLGAYFNSAVPMNGGHAYLVDGNGQLIVSGAATTSHLDTVALAPADLARAGPGVGELTAHGTTLTYARTAVSGTPWNVVLTASSATLFGPVKTSNSWILLGVLGFAALAGMVLLVRIARSRAAAAASALQRGKEVEMLSAITAHNQSLISVKDLQGRYLLANEAFERAFDVTEEDLIGRTDDHLDPTLAPLWRKNDDRARQGLFEVEEWADTADGRHNFESMKFPLTAGNGSVYATCAVSLDVTERRAHIVATEQARDAALAASALQKNFAASASHELRTPTTSILGYVEEVLDNDAVSEEDRGFLEIVYRNAKRLSQLIDDLLILGQAEIGPSTMQLESTDIVPLVGRVIETFSTPAQRAGIELTADHELHPPRGLVDPLRLEQVITNLIGNALKFTPKGGSVKVTIRADHDTVRICIHDTGVGIQADDMNRIFDRFYRTKTAVDTAVKGSGLGLAIAKSMIEAQAGRIDVDSIAGAGSTFTITVPAATPALQLA